MNEVISEQVLFTETTSTVHALGKADHSKINAFLKQSKVKQKQNVIQKKTWLSSFIEICINYEIIS